MKLTAAETFSILKDIEKKSLVKTAEINDVMSRLRKNPHAIEKLTTEDLYDIMQHIQKEYENFAGTFEGMFKANPKQYSNKNFDTELQRQSTVKHLRSLFDKIETEYNNRTNPDIGGIKPLTLQTHSEIREQSKKEFEQIKQELSLIEDISTRVNEWEKRLIKYRSDVKDNIKTMVTSGQMIEAFKDKTPLYLDDFILTEIDLLRLEVKQDTSSSLNIDLGVDKQVKIAFLHELGVTDYLLLNGFSNNNKIADLIEFLTKEPIKKGAANVILGRIQNERLKDKLQSELANLKLKFGIK
jgi:hypothetical protein